MDFKYLYTSTEGRISRKTWWIGILLLIVVNVLASFIILPIIGLGGPNLAQLMAAGDDAAQLQAAVLGSLQTAAWGSLLLFVITAYPIYCLSVKRRRDRNNNGVDVLVYLALIALMYLIQAFGLGFTITDIGGAPVPMPSMLSTVLSAVVGIYAIYMLVVLGFLKGTPGANAYGDDPLTSGAAATA